MTGLPSKQHEEFHVVYPTGKTPVFEDSTFIMGAVVKGAHRFLTVNGQPVPISTHGYFAVKVPVGPGRNVFTLALRGRSSNVLMSEKQFYVDGVPPLPVLPGSPLAVHPGSLLPASDVWLTPQDTLHVACSASIGASVSVTIPGLMDVPVPLYQTPSNALGFVDTREAIFAHLHWTAQRIPLAGYYQATIPVSSLLQGFRPAPTTGIGSRASSGNPFDAADFEGFPLLLHIASDEGGIEQTIPGRLGILQSLQPATIITDRAVTRVSPVDGARLTPQRKGTLVQLEAQMQGWYRARLSRDDVFYIAADNVRPLSQPSVALPGSLSAIRASKTANGDCEVRLTLSRQPATACPIEILDTPTASITSATVGFQRFQFRLYNVCSRCDFMHYPPDPDSPVSQIHWRSVAENCLEVWIDLREPLCGYDYGFSKDGADWILTLRTLPATPNGVRILIDPGHGGTENGSVGLNGLPEKALNLHVAQLLQTALQMQGFSQVGLTRDADETVSLQARGEALTHSGAHILISLHHNALPDGRDPETECGVCTFYYHSQSKRLADVLLSALTLPNLSMPSPLPSAGVYYDSLYITRLHQATAVLVELGFFTSPTDFEQLIVPDFQESEATRLARALKGYILNRAFLHSPSVPDVPPAPPSKPIEPLNPQRDPARR